MDFSEGNVNVKYPDFKDVVACKHYVNQGCINYFLKDNYMVASVMLHTASKVPQAMGKCSEGWYYLSEDEKETLRGKYKLLVEKVSR